MSEPTFEWTEHSEQSLIPLTKELIQMIRNTQPNAIAEEICSVQPMDGKAFNDLYELLKANPDKHLVFSRGKDEINGVTNA